MAPDEPSVIDVTLTDPAAIVRAVADHLAGSCVELCWGNAHGVWHGPAEILGCVLVDGVGCLLAVGLPTDDDEMLEISVAWDEILSVDVDRGDPPSEELLDRLVAASRWFGHRLEITQRDRARVAGVVAGFDLDRHGEELSVILVPAVRLDEPFYAEYAVLFDDIDSVVDRGTC